MRRKNIYYLPPARGLCFFLASLVPYILCKEADHLCMSTKLALKLLTYPSISIYLYNATHTQVYCNSILHYRSLASKLIKKMALRALLQVVPMFLVLCMSITYVQAGKSTRSHHKPSSSSKRSYAASPSPSPSSPVGAINVYDVRSFGAVGDGVADDTAAFKLAWDSACEAGGGARQQRHRRQAAAPVVLAPRGYTFMLQLAVFTGPCRDGIVLQVDGAIVAPPGGPRSWRPAAAAASMRQWLLFYAAHGLTVTGSGRVDGRGRLWWALPCKSSSHRTSKGGLPKGNSCDSPTAMRIFQSDNVTVRGLRIQNSPQFHLQLDGCRNATVDSVTITSPALSPNTDGIHVQNSATISILNSVVSNGDDCISIGSGSFNVAIDNVTCGPSHGISIGSLGSQGSRACVSNITARNSVIRHSSNGLRIKTWQGGSGYVSAVEFVNITMDTVRNPIIIDQYYCPNGGGCANRSSAVAVTGVSFAGITGTYDVRSPPVRLACSDAVPCANVTLSGVELLPASSSSSSPGASKAAANSLPFCWNVYGVAAASVAPPVTCLMKGSPAASQKIDYWHC